MSVVARKRPACGFMFPDYLVIQADWDKPVIMPDGSLEQMNITFVEVDLPSPFFANDCRATLLSWYDAVPEETWFATFLVREKIGSGVKIFVAYDKDFWPTKSGFPNLNGKFGENNWIYIGMLKRPHQSMQRDEKYMEFKRAQTVGEKEI